MRNFLLAVFFLCSLKIYSQNKLTLIASADGDGYTTQTVTITADANKFKLNSGAVLKTFKLQCANLSPGHKLIVSVAGANLTPGTLNVISDNAMHTFSFDQDLAEKVVTVTDQAATGASTTFMTFTFTKGTSSKPSAPTVTVGTPTTVTIKYIDQSGAASPPSIFPNQNNSTKIDIKSTVTSLQGFKISATGLATGHKLIITQAVPPQTDTYSPVDGEKTENWNNLINSTIIIKEDNGDGSPLIAVASVLFNQPANPSGGMQTLSYLTSPQSAISINKYKHTSYGYIDPHDPNTVHLFFDMFGNNLFETIPPGIPNLNYAIHIVYPAYSNQPDDITYSVKQTGGTPSNGSLLFANTGILSSLAGTFQSRTINQNGTKQPYDVWKVKDFYLGNAQDDIPFTITTSVIGDDGKSTTGDLVSYTIKMSSVYHGSFDVGLINSSLRNPSYALTPSPDGSTNNVVKTTNDGKRGMVSVMATLYTSPVILIESLFKKVPSFDLTGRDFVADHKIYERLYPTVGVSVNETAFDNLFYGFNWEIARGLSIFGGRHWGKINTLNISGYTSGQIVTQPQFNYYTNTKWSTAWAYGIKLDILIITNLIGNKK